MKIQNRTAKSIYFIFVSILFMQDAFAQTNPQLRIVEDFLTDYNGEALPGVSIVIKETRDGTVSDLDGHYQIEAPLGSTVVFSFVGFLPEEMKVTTQNSRPATKNVTTIPKQHVQPKNISYTSSMTDSKGIPDYFIDKLNFQSNIDSSSSTKSIKSSHESFLLLRNNWPIYNGQHINIDPSKITDINVYNNPNYNMHRLDYAKNKQHDLIGITYDSPTYKYIPHFSFSHTFEIENVLKLPALQNQYSQGMYADGNAIVTNPGSNNLFSWGPKISNLQYDGQSNPYSTKGNLVSIGNGTGKPAQTYDPYIFFNTGKTEILNASIYAKVQNKHRYKIGFENKRQQGIIPLSENSTTNITSEFEKYNILNLIIGSKYSNYKGKNNLEGPTLSKLLRSVYLTPSTFDNLYGFKKDVKKLIKSAYLLPDGNQRSAAPEIIDNPYYLVQSNLDNSKSNRVNSYVKLNKKLVNFLDIFALFSYDLQHSKENIGFPALHPISDSSIYLTRETKLQHINSNLNLTVDRWYRRFHYKLSAGAYSDIQQLKINRNQSYKNESDITINTINATFSDAKRNVINANSQIYLGYKDMYVVDFKTNYLSSSTLDKKYISPVISTAINAHKADFMRHARFISFLKLRSSWGAFYKEPELFQPLGRFNSLTTNASDFEFSLPDKEVLPVENIFPEKTISRNIGMDLNLFYSRLRFSSNLYINTVFDFIVPAITDQMILLKNAGEIENKGIEMNLSSRIFDIGDQRLDVTFNYSTYTSLVNKVYDQHKIIPIGGFNDIYLAMVEGEQMGAIVGSYYDRNSVGQRVIDEEGYPVVSNDKKVIGNTSPDYLAGISVNYYLEGFALNLTLEIKKGGDVWNGTQNTLSYYGVSSESAEQRNYSDIILSGTVEDSRVNNTAIDYANPQNGMNNNIWYRYGEQGVAEDAIEDASWIRMKNTELSYTLPHYISNRIEMNTIKFSVYSHNMFLITKYKGVDPESTLWGQDNNLGLDYFNMPTTKSWGLKINLVF